MFRQVAATIVVLSAMVGSSRAQQTESVGDPVIDDARIKVAAPINVPAREAGVLVELPLKEGMLVSKDKLIGKIDESEPLMQKRAAAYALNAAVKRANDKIEVEYSTKQAEVAQKDYEKMEEANRLTDRAITAVDVRRAKLDWDRALLAIKKAAHDIEVATLEAHVKKAELDAADLGIERRKIISPCDGLVERIDRKQSEWVAPGDTILQLMPMDTMQVDGAVDQSKYDPHEIQNCEVTVEVHFARGRTEKFRGRITKVSAKVGYQGAFNVRAEIANRQQQGSWILRDGLPATMTIHLNTGAGGAVTQAP